MTTTLEAFISLGVSFGEVSLVATSAPNVEKKILAQKYIYFQQENLTQSLKKFWQESFLNPEISSLAPLQSITICSRFMERIYLSKLGGSVAQITTAGFEHWLAMNQETHAGALHGQKYRLEFLASQENVFGIRERVSESGEILQPLQIQELELIHGKLKLLGIQRVCINFLHSTKNPQHLSQAHQYFQELGYEVFSEKNIRSDNATTECERWRKNVLNACLWGTFQDIQDEIKKSLEGFSIPSIRYLNSEGQRIDAHSPECRDMSSFLFGFAHLLTIKSARTLYLGAENWFWIERKSAINSVETTIWQSPWGPLALRSPQVRRLQAQPTLEMIQSPWGGLLPSENELGYEPGPMLFGRSLRLLSCDLLFDTDKDELIYISESGKKRFMEHMNTLQKNIPELKETSIKQLREQTMNYLAELILSEIPLASSVNPSKDSKIYIAGYFAERFFPILKRKVPQLELAPEPVNYPLRSFCD